MKTKNSLNFIFRAFVVLGLAVVGNNVLGQEADSGIRYPVAELGNCADKAACAAYCDKSGNAEACLDFAEKNNLMSKGEVDVAKNFIAAGNKGPGGCSSIEACETYCDDISKVDECVSFAEKNNLMPPKELEEAKKVQAAIARGVKPPPCANKKQCDVYCEDPNHMEECISFASEAGFMQGQELEDAQKMLGAIRKGVKPPPCKGKDACDEYCSAPSNMEVCTNFAIEAGFMNEKEKADAQKMIQAIKKGVNPPKCRGKEECDAYCGMDEHFEECLNFAEAAGFMSGEDADMARKTGGKGPGGCKAKEECEAFCNNPDNQETCFNFAKDNGLISEEDLKQMEEGKQQMQQALQQAPAEMVDCLTVEMGADVVEKLKVGTLMPSKEIGDKMSVCSQKIGNPSGAEGMMQPGEPGPGGCTSPEECKAYCESHQDECQQFQPGSGVVNPGDQLISPQSGPGGCKSPEECQTYCTANPQECQNFAPGAEPHGQVPSESMSQNNYSATSPSGPGGCSSPEECQTFCTNNPQECQNFAPPSQPSMPPLPIEGSNSYPENPIQPAPCEGNACYEQGGMPQQPVEENTPVQNGSFYPEQPSSLPPPEMQPPLEQQQQTEPLPENLLQPLSVNTIYNLLTSVPRIISFFINR